MKHAPADAARDLLLAKTGEALACLAPVRLDDERVHAARKALKSARAGLRLLRPRLGETAYARENIALRDAARDLSPLRDARSLLGSLDLLAPDARRHPPVKQALARLRPLLRVRLNQAHEDLAADPAARRHCTDLVRDCRERTVALLAEPNGGPTLREAFTRVYRKARKTHVHAARLRSAEALHEWRKQTKYLLTTAAALREAGVEHLRTTVRRADRIADHLGDDHDLSVLAAALPDFAGDSDARLLLPLIERRRVTLQKRALRTGAKLFARKPRRLAGRVSGSIAAAAPRRASSAPSARPAAPAIHCRAPSARRPRAGAGRRPA